MTHEHGKRQIEKAILVGLASDSRRRSEQLQSLQELRRLANTAGAAVLAERVQVRPRPDPAFYIGRGLVEELRVQLSESEANCVIFDDPLSPAQQRNLEETLDTKVIDRPVLILDIFASGARTAAARMQVELAQLEYMLPRLTGAWVHFSRQYGGIGAKGPGETQLEIDRRQVRIKIAQLKKRIEKLGTQRQTQRKARSDLFKIALVGYTNAGKSTLFNALTRADVQTADRLFTTLDSTTRVMSAGYPTRVVFSDTVGFIRKLPHQLVESFKSTLEEVALADLILLVADCSDPKMTERIGQTREVLVEIEADMVPYLTVYNKHDANPEFVAPANNASQSFVVSALQNQGLAALKAELVARSGRNRSAPGPVKHQ
ncbi:MAG: GTPase HflX [Candidatus Zixiibacteriota bacterium]